MSDEHSILRQLEAKGKSVPRVELRPDDSGAPVLRQTGRFAILGELAQGGVGVVMKGRDVDLGRDVALKVLREGHARNPEIVQRFVDEAQIGGQLQHPGIVPVYELGVQKDKRPFFAMKLVKGRTLAALLKERADRRRRYLQIFEQVCETVAYAHVRGVIHRDLKPANIMVGAFDEVQVLDWGFAKVLPRGGIADERETREIDVTRIATVRSAEGSASVAGSVMGTPAYMPPEQALGEVDALDERCDVFSLGAILCEILTGKPPYVGDDLFMQAAHARLDDAYRRLDECNAAEELVTLAKTSLSPVRADRPRDAGALAAAVHDHLAEVEERAHRAALGAARSRAMADRARSEAAHQRRARRMSFLAGAAVLLAAVIGGGGYLLLSRAQHERTKHSSAVVGNAIKEVQRLRGEKQWKVALAAAEQALELARSEDVDEGTRGRARTLHATVADEAERARVAAEQEDRDAKLLAALEEARFRSNDEFDYRMVDQEYVAAFEAYGIELDAKSGFRIRARGKAFATEVAAALDFWIWIRQAKLGRAMEGQRQAELAAAIDGQPRKDVSVNDLDTLRAAAANLESLSAARALLLGLCLQAAGDRDGALDVLRRALRRHPNDLWILYQLGLLLQQREPREAVRYLTAALALRPDSVEVRHRLGIALEKLGDRDAAIDAWRDAMARRPKYGHVLAHIAWNLRSLGRTTEALEVAREAVRLQPGDVYARRMLADALHEAGRLEEALAVAREAVSMRPRHGAPYRTLGDVLAAAGRLDEAIEAYEKAIQSTPDLTGAYVSFGSVLAQNGSPDRAIQVLREAIRQDPRAKGAHNNLGLAYITKGLYDEAIAAAREAIRLWPDSKTAHNTLGNALKAKGLLDEAMAAYREALRIDPGYAHALSNLGNTLAKKGRLDDAIAAYRKCLAAEPDTASFHCNLGIALRKKGLLDQAITAHRNSVRLAPDEAGFRVELSASLRAKGLHEEAIEVFREGIRRKPEDAGLRYSLGNCLVAAGRLDDAIGAFREAIRLDPDHAEAHCNLGHALRRIGAFGKALRELRRGHELGSRRPDWPYPSKRWVQQSEQLVRLDWKLRDVLAGDAKPANAQERIEFAAICRLRKQYATAARFYRDAFAADPALAETGNRYDGACAAVLAQRDAWRAQALVWLNEELAHVRKLGTKSAALLRSTLQRWKSDPDLASVRDAAALARLSKSEEKAWQGFWRQVGKALGDR